MKQALRVVDRFSYYILLFLFTGYCVVTMALQRPADSFSNNLFGTAIIMTVARQGVYFILWIQLKNPLCPQRVLRFFVMFFLFALTISFPVLMIDVIFAWQGTDSLIPILVLISAISGCVRFYVRHEQAIDHKG